MKRVEIKREKEMTGEPQLQNLFEGKENNLRYFEKSYLEKELQKRFDYMNTQRLGI